MRAERHLPPHLQAMQGKLEELIPLVLDKRLAPRQAEVVALIVGHLLALSKYNRELAGNRELEERLAALEALAPQRSARGY